MRVLTKKNWLLRKATCSGLMVIFLSSFAQAEPERSMAVGISPISGILGGIDALFQVKIREYLALTLSAGASYDWAKVVQRPVTRAPLSFFGGIGTKFYIRNQGFQHSFYIEPRLSLDYSQIGFSERKRKLYDSKALAIVPTLRAGWDWYFASNFFMSLGAGIGANIYVKKRDTKLPKSTDFPHKRLLFPPRDRIVSLALSADLMLGVSW